MTRLKYLLMAMLITSCSLSLKSQVEFGTNIGLSTFRGIIKNSPYPDKIAFNNGVAAAIYLKIPLKGNFSLQPEINFIQKGGNDAIHDFFEIPILLKYQIPLAEKHAIEVGLGAGFGKTIGKNYRLSGEPVPYLDFVIYDRNNGSTIDVVEYKGYDIDGIFDISYSYLLKNKTSLVGGFRTQYDFIDSYNWTEVEKELYEAEWDSPHPVFHNFGFVTYVGVSFRLGK